jgi:hypothetical protein
LLETSEPEAQAKDVTEIKGLIKANRDASHKEPNVTKIGKHNKQPKAASTLAAKTGGKPMTLKELMAEDPSLRADVEAIMNERYEAGVQSVHARNEKVVAYFENKHYPESVKNLAIKVLKGEEDPAALIGAITVIDAQVEHDKQRSATEDSKDIKPTPSQQNPALSQDGVVRSVADEQAMLARLNGGVN